MNLEQLENRALAERYPFLIPRNVWTDEVIEDYNYEFLYLKDLYPGWWIRFGVPLCEDLRDILIRNNYLDKFRFSQVKEKYGSLCLYDFGAPEEWFNHLAAWEYISEHTCIKCGAFPVSLKDDGWISPYCDDCWSKMHPKAGNKPENSKQELDKEIILKQFSKEGTSEIKIDLLPFYKAIGYEMK